MPQAPIISYPTPAYSNVPIEPTFYQPRMFFIENITLGVSTLVETTEDHDYVIGQQVRLIIPFQAGCRQLNEQQGIVESIPSSNTVLISIDSSQNVNQFTASVGGTQPQILAIGDNATGNVNSSGRTNQNINIPGSFINIS